MCFHNNKARKCQKHKMLVPRTVAQKHSHTHVCVRCASFKVLLHGCPPCLFGVSCAGMQLEEGRLCAKTTSSTTQKLAPSAQSQVYQQTIRRCCQMREACWWSCVSVLCQQSLLLSTASWKPMTPQFYHVLLLQIFHKFPQLKKWYKLHGFPLISIDTVTPWHQSTATQAGVTTDRSRSRCPPSLRNPRSQLHPLLRLFRFIYSYSIHRYV